MKLRFKRANPLKQNRIEKGLPIQGGEVSFLLISGETENLIYEDFDSIDGDPTVEEINSKIKNGDISFDDDMDWAA